MTLLQDREQLIFSSGILRLVGYGLLLMATVDIFFLLVPPQLMNPVWEFETMGIIVERIPLTLLGMVLVYYGESSNRAPIENLLLKFASWLSLALTILLILTIPLSINNGFRIYHQQKARVNAQFVERKDAIQQYQDRLKLVDSKAEITQILQQGAKQKINIPDTVDPLKLKQNIIDKLQSDRDSIDQQLNTFKSQKRISLIKKCLRWNIGALIAAILFFLIWKSTGWARINFDEE